MSKAIPGRVSGKFPKTGVRTKALVFKGFGVGVHIGVQRYEILSILVFI